ncbi:MAG: calcium-binding protein [Sulfuritalea sp.]|nr:calcium-binding protein [Sulfuritalea sp.]
MGAGNDINIARGGSNYLDGGEGRDWYVFDTGSGINHIADSGPASTCSGHVRDELHIDNFDPDNPLTTCAIDTFQFADRSLSLQEILDIGMDLEGTPQDDFIVGTGMKESINALAGDDIILAGGGNDVIDASAGNDTIDAGEGNDSVIGGEGNDLLDGGTGSDSLAGGTGDDSYVVDDPADTVIELAAQGIDTVQSSISHTLAANLENLTLTGTANTNATGNELNNTLTGNAGNNVLDGKVGADTTAGGAGDDSYLIDNAGDIVIEDLDAGTDTVLSSLVNYTLTDKVENLSPTLTANQNGTGNALDNTLTGNTWVNVLDGGSGADVMDGGLGNDSYVVDDTGDQVIEALVGPTYAGTQWFWSGTRWETRPYTYVVADAADTVKASIDYTLGANLENLTLTGTANLDGTGNALHNLINGNDGDNVLLGLDGYDSLQGGAGSDVLEGDDALDGGTGADVMDGGLGYDTYTVDNASDQLIEGSVAETWWGGQGWDTANSSVSYTLPDNVESLVLTGTDNIDGSGSAQDNRIIGNEGINLLAGGQGGDRLVADRKRIHLRYPA